MALAAALGFWLALLLAAMLRLRVPEIPVLDPALALGVLVLLGGTTLTATVAAARDAAGLSP
ncbi:MAG: hypothetical protein GWN71_19125, partial [Gammaproteobacteria bacterium]|nr:hypothetical protein [Gemmatimonadota bacterium]NIU75606.1 hypothetical protein [Gammaproteobacteria bacterium]NIX19331.1 hypothetical protein [Actinomycetota bacterium]